MKKLNKVLALLCAGAMVTGAGAFAACNNTTAHDHSEHLKYVTDGYEKHHAECTEDDYKTAQEAHEWGTDNKCSKCGQDKKVNVTKVTVSGNKQVKIGESITLTADVTPANASEKSVTWAIKSGKEYADITGGGVLTGKAAGNVTVTATADGVSGEYAVEVLSDEAAITLSSDYAVLENGYDESGELDDLRTVEIGLTYTGSATLTATFDKDTVATAEIADDNSKITLTAKEPGKATLTVSDGEIEQKITVETATYGLEYGAETGEGEEEGTEVRYMVVGGSERLTATDVYIPGYYWSADDEDYLPVTTIKSGTMIGSYNAENDGAFTQNSTLVSVYTGDNVVLIGGRAFSECTALTTVHFGPALKTIGVYGFNGCTSLEKIDLSEAPNFARIDRCGFAASGLTEINIPKSCETIGDSGFSGCESLTVVRILSDKIEKIWGSTFLQCTSLSELWLNKSVTTIAKDAFGTYATAEITIHVYYNGSADDYAAIIDEDSSFDLSAALKPDKNKNCTLTCDCDFDEMFEAL